MVSQFFNEPSPVDLVPGAAVQLADILTRLQMVIEGQMTAFKNPSDIILKQVVDKIGHS